ncbi:hypothetical protein [Streptomyces cinereoruber]|uniref:hypothetical protein n=1 Tax=Streptomyces cinereoruber TaxID=67260 RepID=UPI003C308A6E
MAEQSRGTRINAYGTRGSGAYLQGFPGSPGSLPAGDQQGTNIYTIFEGTSEIQRLVISRTIAK